MVLKTYLAQVAYVADGGSGTAVILAGAEMQVYAASDLARTTPLATFYLDGTPRPSLNSNRDGLIPAFCLQDVEDAVWRIGDLEGALVCREGITGAPGSNVLPLRDALIAELIGPGEVRTYMDSEYRTDGLSAQLTAIQDTAASVEELTGSVVIGMGATVDSVVLTNNRKTMTWTAPFPCELVSASLVFDYTDIPASETNYAQIGLVNQINEASSRTIAAKTTRGSDGEPVVQRRVWDFAQVPWGDPVFNPGETLAVDVLLYGTTTVRLPMCLTFRYRPL